jgi:hypothetical protein
MSNIPEALQSYQPYVVSADAAGLLRQWADEHGMQVPDQDFFDEISYNLGDKLQRVTGQPVQVVPEAEMRDGMAIRMSKDHRPIVSLDRAYVDSCQPGLVGYIDATRAVHEVHHEDGSRTFPSAGGLRPRPGFPSIQDQLAQLRTPDVSPITIVDDVIFAGDGAVDLAERLKAVNRPVERIVAGIGILAGVEKIRAAGIEVDCVRIYDSITDEVCERDFLAGVPMSGRTVLGEDGSHWSAPYFLPYGHPEQWASIPADRCKDLSRFCLEQSIRVWEAIEDASGVQIPAQAVPRVLRGSPDHASVTMLLKQDLAKL